MTETKHYLSIRDVCARLGVDYKTIWRQVKLGELPAARIGNTYRIAIEDVEAYLSRSRQARMPESRSERDDPLAADRIVVPTDDEERAIAEDRLADARLLLASGEIDVLLTSLQARLRETSATGRFERKLKELIGLRLTASLLRDLTGRAQPDSAAAMLRIAKPETFITTGDERDRLMDYLGIGFIDRNTVETRPLNQWVAFRMTAAALNQGLERARTAFGLTIELRVVSDLKAHADAGFAARRLSEEDFFAAYQAAREAARDGQFVHVLALASTVGWTRAAIETVARQGSGGLTDTHVMPVLVDLANNTAHYDRADLRIEPFVSLFTPVLRDERIVAAMDAIRDAIKWSASEQLGIHELGRIANQADDIVVAATQRLLASGQYRARQVEGLEPGKEEVIEPVDRIR